MDAMEITERKQQDEVYFCKKRSRSRKEQLHTGI